MEKSKNKIIAIMCIAIMIMAVGYAYFATSLNITTTGHISSSWKVYFSNMTEGVATGSATNMEGSPTYTNTTATMSVDLKLPGDAMTYEITLTNGGDIDAIIENIDASVSEVSAIRYSISGISIGDKLAAGESKIITVKIEYDKNTTSQPSITENTLTVNITTVQDLGQTITPSDPIIEGQPVLLSNAILRDNTAYADNVASPYVTSSTGIDFSKSSTYVSSYNEVQGTTSLSLYMPPSSTYYYGSGYTFDTTKGEYSLTGTTRGSWSTMSSNYQTYPYTCMSTSSTGTCTTLYKMIGYTSSSYGTAYKYTRSENYSNDNGQGLYYTSTNTEGNMPTYYFRGNVENNYVQFGQDSSGNDLYWRIVRTNEDGSTRLIYQGTSTTATGSDATIGTSTFNGPTGFSSDFLDNAYTGYMYGTAGSSTYALTHTNTNDSTVKGVLDSWYEDNLIDYSSYLADAGFCNDRSIAESAELWSDCDTALGYGPNWTHYGAWSRFMDSGSYLGATKENPQPQFTCPQTNDLFTTTTSTIGNKALTYPVGLITADEVSYAGAIVVDPTVNSYLNIGTTYWTMTPGYVRNDVGSSGGGVRIMTVSADGALSMEYPSIIYVSTNGIRPVINLKSTVEITEGDGTSSNPYIVKTN